jgi:pantothenate kinase
VLSLSPAAALATLVAAARALPTDRRVVIGITGGPGTGKSTLTAELVAALGPEAAYVPMDGFHMLHAKLEALGTVKDKGAPHTFEGAAFASFLSTLKSATTPISGPGYSRVIEDVVQDAFIIAATCRATKSAPASSNAMPSTGSFPKSATANMLNGLTSPTMT